MKEVIDRKILKICMQYMKQYDEKLFLHSMRVTKIACRICRVLSNEAANMVFIKPSAMLHDIGKLFIPEQILYKPERLTQKERDIINEHSYLSYKLLYCLGVAEPVRHIVLLHHGTKVSKCAEYETEVFTKEEYRMAQLLKAADAYEALTSDRVYHKRMSAPDALCLMESEQIFHPNYLAALKIVIERGKEVCI